MLILILCNEQDPSYLRLKEIFDEREQKHVLFHGRFFPYYSSLSYSISNTQNVQSIIKAPIINDPYHLEQSSSEIKYKIHSNEILSVWNRRCGNACGDKQKDPYLKDTIEQESQRLIRARSRIFPDAFWASDQDANWKAAHKPYQLQVAKEVGFLIPDTYIGNDVEEAEIFIDQYEYISMKTIDVPFRISKPFAERVMNRSVRFFQNFIKKNTEKKDRIPDYQLYPDSFLYSYEFFTKTTRFHKSELLGNLLNLSNCPMIIQPYIEKAYELRVTIIGNKLFACKLDNQGVLGACEDWRDFNLNQVEHSVYNLPAEIKSKCFALIKKLNLQYGCIDLIATPHKDYIFLENNHNGQWGWVEEETGMPIAEALADLLMYPDQNAL